MRSARQLVCLALALSAFGIPSALSPAKSAHTDLTADALLATVYDEISRGRVDAALQNIEDLISVKPNFRLAQLIKGDLLMARAGPIDTLGAAPNAPAARVDDLRAEAFARLRAYRDPPPADRVPRYLLQMREDQRYAVVVDTHLSRLYLYQNDGGKPRFVADYYVSSGKNGALKAREGDERTPVGVYHVTASLPRSKLAEFYGSGAFPINYPNEWDQIQGRNGHGIWLHGTPPDTYSRPPRSSNGCVVLANADLNDLAHNLQIGLTPVIISEDVEWLSADDWAAERREFREQLDGWRTDWESLDADRYLSHYSKRFLANGQNFEAWSRHKRLVNGSKSWIKVKVDNVSMFRNPGKEELVVVTFDQEYRSNNLTNTTKKRQYWIREDGLWRIVYEGTG
jgi:murein L,D-transpeptidase YafK